MISIIIPCRAVIEASSCIDACQQLDHDHFEIIVLPDELAAEQGRLRIIPTGDKLPSHKRDIGIKEARGDIVAFIDSDATPRQDWLKEAEKELHDDVIGVCGAGILPPDSNIRQQASDKILRLLPFSYRVRQEHSRFVTDYPTFSLILRKDIVEKMGGFSCDFLTGEDSKLCQKITDKGYKILYTPDVVVYHRRRPLITPFLRQVSVYARHRGHFLRKGYGNSRRFIYLCPSLGLVCLLLWVIYLLF